MCGKVYRLQIGYYIYKICTIWNFFSYYTNCKGGQVVYRIAVGFLKGCNRPNVFLKALTLHSTTAGEIKYTSTAIEKGVYCLRQEHQLYVEESVISDEFPVG